MHRIIPTTFTLSLLITLINLALTIQNWNTPNSANKEIFLQNGELRLFSSWEYSNTLQAIHIMEGANSIIKNFTAQSKLGTAMTSYSKTFSKNIETRSKTLLHKAKHLGLINGKDSSVITIAKRSAPFDFLGKVAGVLTGIMTSKDYELLSLQIEDLQNSQINSFHTINTHSELILANSLKINELTTHVTQLKHDFMTKLKNWKNDVQRELSIQICLDIIEIKLLTLENQLHENLDMIQEIITLGTDNKISELMFTKETIRKSVHTHGGPGSFFPFDTSDNYIKSYYSIKSASLHIHPADMTIRVIYSIPFSTEPVYTRTSFELGNKEIYMSMELSRLLLLNSHDLLDCLPQNDGELHICKNRHCSILYPPECSLENILTCASKTLTSVFCSRLSDTRFFIKSQKKEAKLTCQGISSSISLEEGNILDIKLTCELSSSLIHINSIYTEDTSLMKHESDPFSTDIGIHISLNNDSTLISEFGIPPPEQIEIKLSPKISTLQKSARKSVKRTTTNYIISVTAISLCLILMVLILAISIKGFKFKKGLNHYINKSIFPESKNSSRYDIECSADDLKTNMNKLKNTIADMNMRISSLEQTIKN